VRSVSDDGGIVLSYRLFGGCFARTGFGVSWVFSDVVFPVRFEL
jgi:hypothetical protein